MKELRRVSIEQIAFEEPTPALRRWMQRRRNIAYIAAASVFSGMLCIMLLFGLSLWVAGLFLALPALLLLSYFTVPPTKPAVRLCSIAEYRLAPQENGDDVPKHLVTLIFADTGQAVCGLSVMPHFPLNSVSTLQRVLLCREHDVYHLYLLDSPELALRGHFARLP